MALLLRAANSFAPWALRTPAFAPKFAVLSGARTSSTAADVTPGAGVGGAAGSDPSTASDSPADKDAKPWAAIGEVNMPTRSIAAVLLQEGGPVKNTELYERAAKFGLLKSRTHFKQVLKMMKTMKRVHIVAKPPEQIGGAKLMFCTKLTPRGEKVYRSYLEGHPMVPSIDGTTSEPAPAQPPAEDDNGGRESKAA